MKTTIRKTETEEELKAAVARVAVPSKMTAAVLYGSEDLRVEMIDVPSLAADEVLLRVRLALTAGAARKIFATICFLTTAHMPSTCAFPAASPWKTCWECRTRWMTKARRLRSRLPAFCGAFTKWRCAPATLSR